jgi:hypothetical protein
MAHILNLRQMKLRTSHSSSETDREDAGWTIPPSALSNNRGIKMKRHAQAAALVFLIFGCKTINNSSELREETQVEKARGTNISFTTDVDVAAALGGKLRAHALLCEGTGTDTQCRYQLTKDEDSIHYINAKPDKNRRFLLY